MKKLIAVFLALLLLSVAAVGVSAQSGGAGYYDFETSVRMWQNLIVRGSTTFIGGITAADDMTVGDQLAVGRIRYTKGTTQTLTASGEITSAYTYQPIAAAGAIGTSAVAAGTAGDILIIANTGANTITLTDTATLMLPANVVLGPKGRAVLISEGADGWSLLSSAAN
jgi:uncharacterized membrane-anchored protein